MRTPEEITHVLSLIQHGFNNCEIERATGISRSTIRAWRAGRIPGIRTGRTPYCDVCRGLDYPDVPSARYAYLLGQYLGDGHIARMRRGVYCLRVVSDRIYPGIIEETALAMRAVMPISKVNVIPARKSRAVIIFSYSKHWPCLFPQHGPGRNVYLIRFHYLPPGAWDRRPER